MTENIIDIKDALYRIQGDKELLVELVEIFLDDCPQRMDAFKRALDDQDAQSLAEISHSLKGAAANISAKRLWDIFIAMENASKNNAFDQALSLWQTATQHMEQLKEYFPKLKETLASF